MLLHILWSYLLVFQAGLGLTGASIATCITYWLNLILVTLYLSYKEDAVHKTSWHAFNYDSLKGWWEYLSYGIPSTLMLCLEWWFYEILALYAGMLSVNELAANVVLFNMVMFLFQVPLGISCAVSNLVGNSMGDMKPRRAKRYFIASLGLTIVVTIVLISLLISFR